MPSADQVPINNPHSTMLGGSWVVLIAGSTGSALRAVRPPNLHITPGWPARSHSRRKCDGFLVALALGHHRPRHARELIGERDGGDLGRYRHTPLENGTGTDVNPAEKVPWSGTELTGKRFAVGWRYFHLDLVPAGSRQTDKSAMYAGGCDDQNPE